MNLLSATLPLNSWQYWLRLGILLLACIAIEQVHVTAKDEYVFTALTLGFTVLLPSLIVRRAAYTQVAAEVITLYMLLHGLLSFLVTYTWEQRLLLPTMLLCAVFGWLRLRSLGIKGIYILWVPLFLMIAAVSVVWLEMSLR